MRMRDTLTAAAAFSTPATLKRYLTGLASEQSPLEKRPEDWEEWGAATPVDARTLQEWLTRRIEWWLRVGGVRLRLGMYTSTWDEGRAPWRIELTYTGLVGGLAYRLLLGVIGEERLYACDACGEPYIRTTRAPRPGQENFCPNCGDVAQKRALARKRARDRAEIQKAPISKVRATRK